MTIDPTQLQSKYKHAGDFGVTGPWNKQNAAAYEAALKAHVNNPNVLRIQGTYHGNAVIHHVDPHTGLNVMHTRSGEFIGGWQLNPQQLNHVLMRGSL